MDIGSHAALPLTVHPAKEDFRQLACPDPSGPGNLPKSDFAGISLRVSLKLGGIQG
jgi:hypothetical protein